MFIRPHLKKLLNFFLTLWRGLWMNDQPTQKQEIPFDPKDSSAKFKRLQEMLKSGLSYRAISRATGVSKKDLKAIQIRPTGRFFFYSKKDDLHSNKELRAELWDPISATSNSPIGVPLFKAASHAWLWLETQRELDLKRKRTQPALDPTPAGV